MSCARAGRQVGPGRARAGGRRGAVMKPQASPATSPHQAGELRRHQEMALAAVAAEGPTQVAELLLAARRGDAVASGLAIGPVLRALPGVDWLTAHDLLRRAGIPDEATPLG